MRSEQAGLSTLDDPLGRVEGLLPFRHALAICPRITMEESYLDMVTKEVFWRDASEVCLEGRRGRWRAKSQTL